MARPISRISRVLMTGPLAPFPEAYRVALAKRGYTPRTVVNQLRQVARLSQWLKARGLAAAELTGEGVEDFLAFQRASERFRSHWSRPGLLCLLDLLRELEVVPAPEPAEAGSPEEGVLARFERHLLAERALAAGTARGYGSHARAVLVGLSPPGALAGLAAEQGTQA